MIGLALLGGKPVFTGHIGNDAHGESYRTKLAEQGVRPNLGVGKGDTGTCVVLVTPDTERTMCTYLGMCRELCPADVDLESLKASEYIYVTGYLWDTDSQKEAVLHAMSEANKSGVKVALSLSDPFCVNRHKEDFQRIVRDHVDLVIGNEVEAKALTDTDNEHDAAKRLGEWCELAAVTRGPLGSLIRTGNDTIEVPSFPVKAVDATGAGDMYAGAILFGLTKRMSLSRAGRIAAYMAAQVVAKMGPRVDCVNQEELSAFAGAEVHN